MVRQDCDNIDIAGPERRERCKLIKHGLRIGIESDRVGCLPIESERKKYRPTTSFGIVTF